MPMTPAMSGLPERDAEAQQERAVGQAEDADVRAEPRPEQLPRGALALGLGDDVDAVGLDGDPRGGCLARRVDGVGGRLLAMVAALRSGPGGCRSPLSPGH